MSQRIETLTRQFKSMPKPAEEQAGRMWDSGNCFCDALSGSIDSAVTDDRPPADKLKTIMETGFAVEILAYRQNKVDERIKILRAMYLTAAAVIQGKPEPSDAEVAALQSAPIMEESKIPALFRKAKATPTTGKTDVGAAAPPSPKPWWRIW